MLEDMIERDPAICGGQPTFRGTRVPLRTVLGYLSKGEPVPTILADYPSLTERHVRAAIAFAAASASDDLPAPPPASKGSMRITLDENVTATAAPPLRALDHDVDTVLDEVLGATSPYPCRDASANRR
jgi:uncharacterized protein (DUF433 family)